MKVCLTYFKYSGKYYSAGEYECPHENLGDIWDHVKLLMHAKNLPGLTGDHEDFYVLVDVPEHKYNHPRLIIK